MSKAGNEYTDKQIEELEKELTEVYSRAGDELEKKASAYFARFEKQDKEKQKLVAEGKMTQADYNKWRTGSMMTGQRWKTLKEQSAKTLLEANKNAVKLANGKLPSIYMFNYNETGKDAQDALKGISFDLINERALARMLKDKITVLPFKEVDGKKVERWDTRKINAEVTQGIIQGESVQKIAKRFRNVSEMDKRYSLLNARTAMTGAENRGTLDGMAKLEEDGVILHKVWIATHDRRVRQSHQHIDGESVPVKEEFGNGLMYPGDPDGDPEEVYGCRCSMTTEILGFKSLSGHVIAQGKDISETWQRRPDEFDFEIEDVMNAQGFDGNPRIVSAEEFDELVKQANDGNGFIAQRTYSASDQETLDAYRDQLYNGKWYVDCGTGGAQYGQGMYCAADYTGDLTQGIKNEMFHYQELGDSRLGISNAEFDELREKYKNEAILKSEISYMKGLSDDELTVYKFMTGQDYSLGDKVGEILKEKPDSFSSYVKNVTSRKTELEEMRAKIDLLDRRTFQELTGQKVTALSYTETFTLDPSAKIISYDEARKLRQDYEFKFKDSKINGFINTFSGDERYVMARETRTKIDGLDSSEIIRRAKEYEKKHGSEVYDKLAEIASAKRNEIDNEWYSYGRKLDEGAVAALNGYDAINAKGHGESGSYTVILNRTKLIIKEPKK